MDAMSIRLVLIPALAALSSCGSTPNLTKERLEHIAQFVVTVCSQGIHIEESYKAAVMLRIDRGLISGGFDGAIGQVRDLKPGVPASGKDYGNYLDCVERRLKELRDQEAKEKQDDLCGPKGCVDVTRRADFTKSGCNPDATPRDVVELTNTITFTKDVKIYTAHALRERGTRYTLYHLDERDVPRLLHPQSEDDPKAPLQHVHWNVPVKDRATRTRIVAENTNLTDPGIGFSPAGYVMRTLYLEMILPKGVEMVPGTMRVRTPVSALNACVLKDNAVNCTGVMANEEVEIVWRWNMWDKCAKKK